MQQPTRVIRVGGSLLDQRGLPSALEAWLARQTAAADVLLAGGGKLADVVRQLDDLHQLDDRAAHWACISLMTASARILQNLVAGASWIEDYDELRRRMDGPRPVRIVFAVEAYLKTHEPRLPGAAISHDWSTTSDTIAARLAHTLGADELVLLKSTELPAGTSWTQAAEQGLVDRRFPLVAGELPIRWVNLRSKLR